MKLLNKKNILSILFYCSIITFYACNNNIEKRYYDTGELESEHIKIDEHIKHIKEYYKNGILKSEGDALLSGHLTGHWKEYYSDGVLKWEGNFKEGVRQPYYGWDSLSYLSNFDVSIEFDKPIAQPFEINRKYKFRTKVKEVNIGEYTVTLVDSCNDSLPYVAAENLEDPELYPFVFELTPCLINDFGNGRKYIIIRIWYPNDNGYIAYGKGNYNKNKLFLISMTGKYDEYHDEIMWEDDPITGSTTFFLPRWLP
jgi:antitoxin component YwqK of YwqJK toxin-antitoxin module